MRVLVLKAHLIHEEAVTRSIVECGAAIRSTCPRFAGRSGHFEEGGERQDFNLQLGCNKQ
jgi:hypothetical protein